MDSSSEYIALVIPICCAIAKSGFIDRPDEPNWDIANPREYYKWYFTVDMPGRGKLMEIFKATGTTRVISGHVHCQHDSVFHGVSFDCAPAICGTQFTNVWPEGKGKKGFYVYHAEGADLNSDFVLLKKISIRKDWYGPCGHPKPEIRNYSIVWGKWFRDMLSRVNAGRLGCPAGN